MKVLKAAFVGLGGVAEMHAAGYEDIEEIELVAGADISGERREFFEKRFGLRTYSDYKKMFEMEKPDIVCVLLPAKYHAMAVCDAANAGINVLCEKPLADTIENAERMIKVCEDAGVKLFYGASYRYLPACLKAKEIIDSGKIGEIMFMSEQIIGGNGYDNFCGLGEHHYAAGKPGGGGMGLVDHGIHLVDLFRWFTGKEIIDVYGRGNISGELPVTEHITMTFENGAIGQLTYNEATFYSDMPWEGIFSKGTEYSVTGEILQKGTYHEHPINIRIHGKYGALRVFPYSNRLFITNEKCTSEIYLNSDNPSPGHFGMQIKEFAHNIINDVKPSTTGMDGLTALKIIYDLY
jgi:predicted dehydrogenase